MEKHLFSLFTYKPLPSIDRLGVGQRLILLDPDLWHRVVHVLRLDAGEQCWVFDESLCVLIELDAFTKKGVVQTIIRDSKTITPLKPDITLYQGLLRREAMESVAYFAAQMGVTRLIPLVTEKVQRSHWGGAREIERLKKIMIAACEQSKQYAIPEISEPMEFAQLSAVVQEAVTAKSKIFYCESDGQPFIELLRDVNATAYQSISIVIGPEGGLSADEQATLSSAGAQCYALTPTILRAQEAVAVCVGAVRSVAVCLGSHE